MAKLHASISWSSDLFLDMSPRKFNRDRGSLSLFSYSYSLSLPGKDSARVTGPLSPRGPSEKGDPPCFTVSQLFRTTQFQFHALDRKSNWSAALKGKQVDWRPSSIPVEREKKIPKNEV